MKVFMNRKAAVGLIAALTFGTGGASIAVTAGTAGTAGAAACGTPLASCTATGTLTVTGGSLTLTAPSSLTWAATLNGSSQNIADIVSGDQQYTVNDASGTGAGWNVTVSATTFTNGTHTLPNTGTFVTTGSVTSIAGTTGPTTACVTTCTLPTNSQTYPVAITTAASTPPTSKIYDTSVATGLGAVVIGGSAAANPVGWWVVVPSNAFSGAYTSTVTMAVVSAP